MTVGRRRVDRRRRLRAAAATTATALAVLGVLTGCTTGSSPAGSPSASPGSDPAAAALGFLRAIADGDLATAVALSTSSATAFACDDMTTDGRETGLAAPEVGAVEVDGATATAAVSYSAPLSSEHTETLDLSLVDGSWRVELPEAFRISVTFDAPTVAEVVIDDTCSVPVVDAAVDVVAWPGLYTLHTVDPTGVLTEREDAFLLPVPADEDEPPVVLPSVPAPAFAALLEPAGSRLVVAMEACVRSGFTDASCPPGVAGADPPTDTVDRLVVGDYFLVARIWTDDEETWRFETAPATISVSFDGVPTDVAFTTTGTLSVDGQGELVVAVDAP